jgi:small subunit ribosomal protein S6
MNYELSFIISSNLPETEHSKVQEEILDYIKHAKATVTKQPYLLGRKKLAYPIKKQKHGFYVFLEFGTENPEALRELDTKLKHNNALLRHLIIKKDANIKTKPISSLEEKPASKKPGKAIKPQPRPIKPVPMPKAEPTQEPKDAKVNLDDIDKKLDELLEKGPEID